MAYTPTVPPDFSSPEVARQWVMEEFERLAKILSETTEVELRPVGRAPAKPREGMIVSANGTTFNPGAGAGAYEYKGGAWVKL